MKASSLAEIVPKIADLREFESQATSSKCENCGKVNWFLTSDRIYIPWKFICCHCKSITSKTLDKKLVTNKKKGPPLINQCSSCHVPKTEENCRTIPSTGRFATYCNSCHRDMQYKCKLKKDSDKSLKHRQLQLQRELNFTVLEMYRRANG